MTAPHPAAPRFTAVADHALLVEFGDDISELAHAAVLALDRALGEAPPKGLREAVPAYVSLLVAFDPLLTDHETLAQDLRQRLSPQPVPASPTRQHEVPVCYEGEFAPDLDEVSRLTGLARDAVIAAHLAGDYRVFMYGFAPGYAYLAGVPPPLHLPRKAAPVRNVAAGSVLIAGPQCLVTPLLMPSGWWVIGRSPTRILTQDPQQPFLFDVGDCVRFRRIARSAFEASHG